ncbi:MAG: FAD-binding protein [Dethiobacter sp.]|jgi:fumarate reductase flavoprotein subunit|nr:FAD-binding protein [Dethiobacter sp.]
MPKKKRKSRLWRRVFMILLLALTLASFSRWSLQNIRPEYPAVPISVDVVVVGSGLAGSVAALSAAEAGADVLLIDLSKPEEAGFPAFSTSFWAAGSTYQEELGIEYSPSAMAAEIYARGREAGNPGQIRELAEASAASLDWLEKRTGVLFSSLADPQLRPGLHLPAFGDAALFVAPSLAKELPKLAAYSSVLRPEKLLLDGGRITGILLRDEEGVLLTVYSRAVILADGGVGGDVGLLFTYTGRTGVVPRPEGGHGGTGIRLALLAGAISESLERAALLPVFLPSGRRLRIAAYPEARYLDSNGNELLLGADAAALSRAGGTTFLVLGAGHGEAGGNFTAYDGIDELAVRLGLPAERLAETLAALDAPYMVAEVGLIALTPGGLATDEKFRVLGPDGPLEGLFAAGEIAAGLHGDDIIPELFFTADTVGPLLAGREAARLALR